jgi:hypothetical protein
MKMRTILFRITGAALALGLVTLSSCQKNAVGNAATDTQSVVNVSADESTSDNVFNEVFDNVAGIDNATAGDSLGLYGTDGSGVFGAVAFNSAGELTNQATSRCFTVTVTPQEKGVFPKTVTIDFGTGCEKGGHLRQGKIITVYSGRLSVPGNQAVTTFDGYKIDSFAIEGKHTLANISDVGGNQRSFHIVVENAKVTNTANGRWRSWSADRTRTQVEGNGTPFWPLDDVFSITGTRSGANSQGKTWSGQTVEPLIRKFTCPWLVKGTVKLTVNGTDGVLDYGDGTCDDQATITVNGVSKTITLH